MRYFLLHIFLPIFFIFLPVLFFGQIFLGGDTIHFSYPGAEFFKSHYLSGLNPYLYLGFPLASSFHYAYFNPVYLLFFKFFNYLDAYHFILFFNVTVAGIFSYLFGRSISLGKKASVVLALTFTLSQFNVFWFTSVTITNAISLTPALFWIIAKITSGKRWFFLAVPLILGYAYLSSHYQFIVMSFVGAFAFLLFRVWDKYDSEKSFFKNLVPLYLFFLGVLGAVLIGAPQILNTYRFFSHTTRSGFINYDYLKLFDLGRYFLPDLNLFKFTSQEFLPYVGIVSLLLALIAVCLIWKKNRTVFFSALMIVFFGSFMFAYSPTAFLFRTLPVFQYFSQTVRWLYVANMHVAILAGFGYEFLVNSLTDECVRTIEKYFKKALYVSGSIFVLMNIVLYFASDYIVAIVTRYFDSNMYAGTSHLPLEYYHNLIKVFFEQITFNFSFLNPNVLLFFMVLITLYLLIRNKKFIKEGIIILILFNLLGSFFINTKFTDRALILSRPYLERFILEKEKDINTFRIFSYRLAEAQYQEISALHPKETKAVYEFALAGLLGNTNNFSLISGLEPNGDRKVQELTYYYLPNKDIDFTSKIPVFSMLNGKYVVTPYEISNTPSLYMFASTSVTKFNVPLYLYENKKVLPRIYFARSVVFLKENDDVINLSKILDPKNDFQEVSYVECDSCKDRGAFGWDDSLKISNYTDELIQIDTKSESGRWVIISNANVIGWHALVDGVKTKIHPANYALQAVYVPRGKHTVELVYKTKWWEL